jgi:hypothetical protein
MGQTVRCVQSETELPKVHVGMEILEALRSLGSQHWELVAVVQAASRVSTHMYVFKRPITSRRHRHLTVLDEEGEDRA